MRLKDFKYQDKETKKQLLLKYGVYLMNRPDGAFILYLFQIDSFYVEVYFDKEEEEIGYIRTFADIEQLAPYLQAIDISEVLQLCC